MWLSSVPNSDTKRLEREWKSLDFMWKILTLPSTSSYPYGIMICTNLNLDYLRVFPHNWVSFSCPINFEKMILKNFKAEDFHTMTLDPTFICRGPCLHFSCFLFFLWILILNTVITTFNFSLYIPLKMFDPF